MNVNATTAVAAAVLAAIAASGTGLAGASTTPPTSGACDATVPGSEIVYGMAGPNAAFDPVGTSGAQVGGTENAAVWDVLFIYDLDSGRVVPHLGESITANDDYTVWTLKLRDGITYSDGTPLDAQLVSDNLDRFVVPEGVRNAAAGEVARISEKRVVDDLTLEMTLNAPFAQFDSVFADEPGEIVNLDAIGDDVDAFRTQPPPEASVGPYQVTRNVPGEETILTARSDYWGGPVCIETIRFVWIPEAQATYDSFTNGDLDVALIGDPSVYNQAESDGVDGHFFSQVFSLNFYLNHREDYDTADPRVREAIMLALDVDVLNDRAFGGQLDAGKAFFGDQSPFWSDAMNEFPTDVERAAELVEEAKADGFDGTISLVSSVNAPGPDTSLAVGGLLSVIGITVEQQSVPPAEIITRLAAGDWDMITNSMFAGPDTALLALARYLGSTSPSNRMGYASDEMDALLGEALATPYDDLPPVMARINDQINTDFAMASYGTNGYVLVSRDISGIIPSYAMVNLFFAASLDA